MKYKAIFFDWDGTAVTSRKAPATDVIRLMEPLLKSGVVLCIISGTGYGNIAGGELASLLSPEAQANLYLGLDRGASNYGFANGQAVLLQGHRPSAEDKIKIDQAAFAVHAKLLLEHGYPTDIVFSRVNYCKIDLQTEMDRGEALFFHSGELDLLRGALQRHGIESLARALRLAEDTALASGIALKATTDAKYIELGSTTKSDNTDYLMGLLEERYQIHAGDCAFWGDEFSYLDEDVRGSDAYMLTEKTKGGDFFDVSLSALTLPQGVVSVGGSVEEFTRFLREQISRKN